MNSGIYDGISIEDYHAGAGISKSGLDLIAKSPHHYWAAYLNPSRPDRTTKPGQLEGSLAHCAILEPCEFSRRYVVGPDASKATREWKDFEKSIPAGVIAIKPDQYTTAWAQSISVRRLPEIASMLVKGKAEQSAYWIDDETGVLCRCRPDWVHPCEDGSVILVDVKTFSDASAHGFSRQVARKLYAKQAAFYSDGYEYASGRRVDSFIFAAVEASYPFASAAYILDEESVEQGRREYRRDLAVFSRCVQDGSWPGYCDGITTISLPRYAIDQLDDDIEVSYV